jgi:DNA-binding YbaB/EbfC family protein
MNIQALMRQAQDMQKKMQKLQEEAAAKEYEGSAAGGMVKAKITGAGIAKGCSIDASLIKVEEKEILEDLIVAAFNDAKKKADESSAESLKAATNGIQLPPGLNLF